MFAADANRAAADGPRPSPALPSNPLRMLVHPAGWGSVLYCATSILIGGMAVLTAFLGFAALPRVVRATAELERHRVALTGHDPVAVPHWPKLRGLWDTRGFADGSLAVWGVTVLFALVDLFPGGILVILVLGSAGATLSGLPDLPLGDLGALLPALWLVTVLGIGLYVAWALAAAQAHLVNTLLQRDTELTRQVSQLTSSRQELVDVFQSERRRIERDLHDGAQQHLVLLGMQLGEAEYALDRGETDRAKRALGAAQSSIEAAMTSLRETVRGIHPQLLTDRGLVAAVRELAERQPVPVQLAVTGDRPPSEPVALAAYYLVSEAFTNAVKHARPSRVDVRLELADPLMVEVRDDGVGGAQIRPGHGLSGLFERAQALGGSCRLDSPLGGPTTLRAWLPNPADMRTEGGEP